MSAHLYFRLGMHPHTGDLHLVTTSDSRPSAGMKYAPALCGKTLPTTPTNHDWKWYRGEWQCAHALCPACLAAVVRYREQK